MGFDLRSEATAIFVELAVPFIAGAVLGIAAAVVIVHVAIGHLDTLRNLQPPAHVIVDLASMAAALTIGVVALSRRRPGHDHDRQDHRMRRCAVRIDTAVSEPPCAATARRRFCDARGTVLAVDTRRGDRAASPCRRQPSGSKSVPCR
jgi:hypothetical protein